MTSCDSSDCWLGALICFLQSSLGTNPHIYNSICPFAFSLSLLQPFSCPLSEPWPLCPFGDSFLGLVEQSGLPSNYIRPFTGGGCRPERSLREDIHYHCDWAAAVCWRRMIHRDLPHSLHQRRAKGVRLASTTRQNKRLGNDEKVGVQTGAETKQRCLFFMKHNCCCSESAFSLIQQRWKRGMNDNNIHK